MNSNSVAVRRAAGTLLVLVPLGFTVCFTLLQQLFEYPDILRQPTEREKAHHHDVEQDNSQPAR